MLGSLPREADSFWMWFGIFFSFSSCFTEIGSDSMVLKTWCMSCSAIVKLPVLPEACVTPCWEKPEERKNVISDCMWAMVWEVSSVLHVTGPYWHHLSWEGVTEQVEHEKPQASVLRAHMALIVSDTSCSALYRFRCCLQAGNRAGLHSVLLGCTVGRVLKSKKMRVQNADCVEKEEVSECSSSCSLPFPALKL